MYCTKCGRFLQDGEICTCETSPAGNPATGNPSVQEQAPTTAASVAAPGVQPAYPQQTYQQAPAQQGFQQPVQFSFEPQPAAPAAPNAFVVYLRVLVECVKSYFKDSTRTMGQAAAHQDIRNGLTIAGVHALLSGLFLMTFIGTLIRPIVSALSRSLGVIAASLLTGRAAVSTSIGIPYPLILLLGFVLTGAAYFGVAAVGLVIGAITHKKTTYLSLLASVGVACLPAAIILAVATVFAAFWAPGGLFLGMAALFTYLIATYSAVKVTLDVADSSISLYYGLFVAVVIGICLLLASRFVPALISQITIGGQSIGSMLTSLMHSTTTSLFD
jgi:hypothetical protein